MKKASIDIAVLLLFFARPEQTSKVFEQIKIARPSKLFLYQDGPRLNRPDDIKGIKECREIVENIDWECEVYRWYQEKNVGGDPSEYLSQKWMFEHVDKGIILEDDDVPSQSFFPFCKELLDKYENDSRICMISGMNHMGQVNIDADYFFCRKQGPIWGWATWKRFVDMWDPQYRFLESKESIKLLEKNGDLTEKRLASYYKHKETGKEHYEDFVSSTRIFNSMLAIIPSKNLISNIGISSISTHSVDNLTMLPPKIRKLYYQPTYEYKFPLKHPEYVINNITLSKEIDKSMFYGPKEKFFLLKRRFVKLFNIR